MIKTYCDICNKETKNTTNLKTYETYGLEHLCTNCQNTLDNINFEKLVRQYLIDNTPSIPREGNNDN